MATKTISVDLEAYDRLRRAKTSERESFSQVIKRAVWVPAVGTAGGLLALVREMDGQGSALAPGAVRQLDRAQEEDRPGRDRWSE